MNYRIEQPSSASLKLSFLERLDVDSVAKIWSSCIATVKQLHPQILILDFQAVNYCDGAGLALIKVLQKEQANRNGSCIIQQLQPSFQKLLEYIEKQQDKLDDDPLLPGNLPASFGRITVGILKNFQDNIIFLGLLSQLLVRALLKPNKIRWHDFFRVAEDNGPQAVPIVALIGFLIGLISTFQAAPSFGDFGMQIYMVDLVGLGLVREMGPLLTVVLLAGRTASSFASEIGMMKINQEIDALKTMGINPVRFLVVPKILAVMLITPILECFFIIFGLLGCLVVMATLGYTPDVFFHRLYQAILPMDYLGGLIKVFVFGLVIASVGCLHGIKTTFGAKALGRATTQAVVSSLIMLVVTDGIFALIYYVMGI